MSPADMPQAEVMCLEIQIATESEGFKIGEKVMLGKRTGLITSFTCKDLAPGAWVLLPTPGSVRGMAVMTRVSLAELRRVK